ncbi:MAG: iron-containing alcohol dehydrogenase, partial [Sedimentisphaerales bacterium]
MRFEFATATRIIFGRGTIQEVGSLVTGLGSFAFVITGRTGRRAEPLLEQLAKHSIKYVTFSVPGEPTTTILKEALQQARQAKVDLVIGIGGGSVLDTGKVVAAMLTNKGQLEEYLEVVGDGQPIRQNPLPYIAIPTTAGTGAEVTRNAVIGVPKHKVKVSMRSPLMLPRVAVVDPALTDSMPPSVTASTGLDALTQLIEAYVSNKASPLTDGICREGLKRAGRSLRRAYEACPFDKLRAGSEWSRRDGSDKNARDDMALASLFSGLALANAKLGAVHGFAGPLGGMISAPHGVICARLLPIVCQANVQALQSRQIDSPALARYDEIARLLTGKSEARVIDGLAWLQELCADLVVPSLDQFGL